MNQIAFAVGIIAVAIYLLGYLQKTRKRIIILNATSRALYILQYLLLSAFEGAVLDIAGIISTFLAQKKDKPIIKKHLKWFVVGVNLLIILLGLTTYRNIYSLLPIAGVLLHTSAFWMTDEKKIRIVSLLGCPFWILYNWISGAYGSVIGDVLSVLSLLVSLFRYDILPQKTKLILIRHGESEANNNRFFAGQYDAPLMPKGIEQAEKTAKYIVDKYSPSKIYSSDLKRAYCTALPISKLIGADIITMQSLREIHAGKWQKVHFDDLKKSFPDEYGVWLNDIGNACCSDGESVKELSERVVAALTGIAKENSGKTVVVVTHATVIRAAMTMIQRGDISCMKDVPWVSNASVTVVEYNGEWKCLSISEDGHLGDDRTVFSANV